LKFDRLDFSLNSINSDAMLYAKHEGDMERHQRLIWIGVACALIFFAWIFRYGAKEGTYGTSLVTDRWTGTVYRCGVYVGDDHKLGCKKIF
jgi:hypothetical protein